MKLETKLYDFTADLITEVGSKEFLKRLYCYVKPGKWVEVAALCEGLSEFEERLMRLKIPLNQTLKVVWLDCPADLYGESYANIIFGVDALAWNHFVIHNRQSFLKEHAEALAQAGEKIG